MSPTPTPAVDSPGDPFCKPGPNRETGLEGIADGGVDTALRPRPDLAFREAAKVGEGTFVPSETRGRPKLLPLLTPGAEGRRPIGVGVEYIFLPEFDYLISVLQGCW
jgi:hypothetical protein